MNLHPSRLRSDSPAGRDWHTANESLLALAQVRTEQVAARHLLEAVNQVRPIFPIWLRFYAMYAQCMACLPLDDTGSPIGSLDDYGLPTSPTYVALQPELWQTITSELVYDTVTSAFVTVTFSDYSPGVWPGTATSPAQVPPSRVATIAGTNYTEYLNRDLITGVTRILAIPARTGVTDPSGNPVTLQDLNIAGRTWATPGSSS